MESMVPFLPPLSSGADATLLHGVYETCVGRMLEMLHHCRRGANRPSGAVSSDHTSAASFAIAMNTVSEWTTKHREEFARLATSNYPTIGDALAKVSERFCEDLDAEKGLRPSMNAKRVQLGVFLQDVMQALAAEPDVLTLEFFRPGSHGRCGRLYLIHMACTKALTIACTSIDPDDSASMAGDTDTVDPLPGSMEDTKPTRAPDATEATAAEPARVPEATRATEATATEPARGPEATEATDLAHSSRLRVPEVPVRMPTSDHFAPGSLESVSESNSESATPAAGVVSSRVASDFVSSSISRESGLDAASDMASGPETVTSSYALQNTLA